jgi:hypothetical protein
MANSITSLTNSLKSDGAVIKTGIIVSNDVYTAVVNVEGVNLTLKLLDSVTAGINRVAVCVIQGDTGFVLGTLDNTARTPSVDPMGTVSSSSSTTVISASSGTYSYTPKGTATWNTGNSTYTAINGNVSQSSVLDGYWFYGAGRFKELQGKTITGFQIYLKFVSGSTASFVYHLYGSQPSEFASWTGTLQTVNGGGWISLPTAWATTLINNAGTGGIAIVGNTASTAKGLPDGGTLKITWKK